MATVQGGLEKLLTGRGLKPGMKPAKTYPQLLAWISKHYKGDAADRPMFSRAQPADLEQAPSKDPAERAQQIINTPAATVAPFERVAKTLSQAIGLERAARMAYDRGAQLLDMIVPERVKAGMVSDYGVPEAVIDRRAELTGRQRAQLRGAGELVDKLATLTRAESRVAYAWMNEADPKLGDALMADLPAESVAVLREARGMIDKLSLEAVRLGQLSQEAYDAHKFAYLRRSYRKHIDELVGSDKAARRRTIAILGNQYKGRGIVLKAGMAQMQAAAPTWWGRKLKDGAADLRLKGEKFIRFEKRTPSGEGTAPIEGMGDKLAEINRLERELQESTTLPEFTVLLKDSNYSTKVNAEDMEGAIAKAVIAYRKTRKTSPGDWTAIPTQTEQKPEQGGDAPALSRAANTGPAMDAELVGGVVRAMAAKWSNAPDILVVRNLQDKAIPQAVRDYDAQQRSQGATGEPEGFYYRGKAYIVASQMRSAADVARVLAHEVLGHAGLRGKFGAELDGVLNQIVTARRADVLAKAKQYGLGTSLRDLQTAAEEVLAELAQTQPQIGFVRRAIAAIRTWLRERGLNLRLSNDEIVRNFILPARAYIERGAGKADSGDPVMLRAGDPGVQSMADDSQAQIDWLNREARTRGFKDIDALADAKPDVFLKLAQMWREKNPAEALLSRSSHPIVSPRTEQTRMIKDGEQSLTRAAASLASGNPVVAKLGRTAHVLGAINAASRPQDVIMRASIIKKLFFDKHQQDGAMAGVTPEMFAHAIAQPSMVFRDTSNGAKDEFLLVTGLLTNEGPMIAALKTDQRIEGMAITEVMSAYGVPASKIAKWINQKSGGDRALLYVDLEGAKVSMTGQPQKESAAYRRRVSSDRSEVKALGQPREARSELSIDKLILGGLSPLNNKYVGWASVSGNIGNRLAGRNGWPHAKDEAALQRFIDKHYKGDAADRPMFYRAQPADLGQMPSKDPAERAQQIINILVSTPAPLERVAQTISRATGLEHAAKVAYDKGEQRDFS